MAKKVAKKRVIHPNLVPQVKMPCTSKLKQMAKEFRLEPTPAQARKGLRPENLAARLINNKRSRVAKINTGIFYTSLFGELYGGIISKRAGMPLFPSLRSSNYNENGFRPDIQVNGDSKNTYVEVKAVSIGTGAPFFGYSQIANGIAALLEDAGSEMITAVFRYGKGHKKPLLWTCKKKEEGKHPCDNRCFVKTLSSGTKDLLILPHNLVSFLLAISRFDEMSQVTSSSSRDFENYKRPYGKWLTFLRDHYQEPHLAIKAIKSYKARYLVEGGKDEEDVFGLADFHLEDLKATQKTFRERVYCMASRRTQPLYYRVRPFTITEYTMPDSKKWTRTVKKKLGPLIELLEIREQYERVVERRAIQSADSRNIESVPDDIAPF